MDKFEYRLRADEIKRYIAERNYKEAASIADTIDWRNVRSSMMLCTVSDLYKACKRFEDSRDILMLAYEKNPGGRMILYSLCELSIKLGDVVNAVEYFKEYSQVAPQDTGRYILKYKLFTAQGVGIEERIAVLEELEKKECKEKWMYELAYLYHMAGFGEQCVEECNQIVIYFGEGKYVVKALELKAMHQPLSGEQDLLYRRLIGPKESDIVVQDMDVSQYNTIDLQKELADSLKEVLFDDTNNVANTDISVTSQEAVYEEVLMEEPSSEEKSFDEEPSSDERTFAPVEDTSDSSVIEDASLEETVETPAAEVDEPTIVINPITDDMLKSSEDPEATKVIDTVSVNAALEAKEPSFGGKQIEYTGSIKSVYADDEPQIVTHDNGFKGTVVEPEPQYAWDRDIREMDLSGSNSPAIKYPNYDDMVSLEGDGQMSIVMPEQAMVDKQITGQISIEDVLLEWERMKSESEKKWQEDMRKRVLQQTTDIFRNFDESKKTGLLEELEDTVNNEEVIILTHDEKESLLTGENPDGLSILIEEEDSDVKVDTEDALMEDNSTEEVLTEEAFEETESGEEELGEPSREELSFDRTPYLNTEESIENNIAKEPDDPDNTQVLPDLSNLDYLMRFAAASEERDVAEKALWGAAQLMADQDNDSDMKEITFEESEEAVKEEEISENADLSAESEEVTFDEPSESDEAESDETVEESEQVIDESTESEEIVDEVAKSEEIIEETSESEEVVEAVSASEDIQDTEEEEDLNAPEVSDTVSEEDAEVIEDVSCEEESTDNESEESDEAVVEEAVKEIAGEDENAVGEDGFTAIQRDRFEDFIQTESGREQILYALDNVSVEASTGNLIIGSDDTDSAVELGKAIITELAETGKITGKVAKIKASTLNAKDAEATLSVLYDGAIIIQDANELRPETIAGICKVISAPDKNMFIILTANHRLKHKFMMNNPDLLEIFNVSIDIEALDNSELAAFAKKYAYEHEYSIDEMGLLALHTKIDERQTNSHSVTVSEVKELIDAAIDHASKKNVGHFFDVLVGKRYDDNDMVVLKEKDFE